MKKFLRYLTPVVMINFIAMSCSIYYSGYQNGFDKTISPNLTLWFNISVLLSVYWLIKVAFKDWVQRNCKALGKYCEGNPLLVKFAWNLFYILCFVCLMILFFNIVLYINKII